MRNQLACTAVSRAMPLLYARESGRVIEVLERVTAPNKIKKVLKDHEPFKRFIYQGRGRKVRDLIAKEGLPEPEQKLRNLLKRKGFWMR